LIRDYYRRDAAVSGELPERLQRELKRVPAETASRKRGEEKEVSPPSDRNKRDLPLFAAAAALLLLFCGLLFTGTVPQSRLKQSVTEWTMRENVGVKIEQGIETLRRVYREGLQ
jgi:hypothetical protein